MELSRLGRLKRGVIFLPLGMSDVDGVHDLLGGNRREVAQAIPDLIADTNSMIRFDIVDGKRAVIISEWDKWNPIDKTAAKRQRDHRDEIARRKAANGPVTRDITVTATVTNGDVTDPRARALISSDLISSSLERESPEGETPAQPASGVLPEGLVRFERASWVAAYERSVVAARGGEPWSFNPKKFGALRSVVEKNCLGADRKNIDVWIERDVRDFVLAIINLDQDSKLWSSFDPDGLVRWHNEQRPGLVRESAPVKKAPLPPLEAPPMTIAETMAEGAKVLAGLSGGRRGPA